MMVPSGASMAKVKEEELKPFVSGPRVISLAGPIYWSALPAVPDPEGESSLQPTKSVNDARVIIAPWANRFKLSLTFPLSLKENGEWFISDLFYNEV